MRLLWSVALLMACTPPPAAPAPKAAAKPSTRPAKRVNAVQLKRLAALKAKGPDYVPRTHHKNDDGSPKYLNRLIFETSPYLLQHAHNPVDWFPWGDEAFARAKELDRPVLLSVGYSTCHWCHVMERESFEDVEIATYINEHFVPIKVDREERPDVDGIYMAAVHLLAGRGGWPMTVVMTPDREPFFAGTYFPARDGDRGARKGFLTILGELVTDYRDNRDKVVAKAKDTSRRVAGQVRSQRPTNVPSGSALIEGASAFARRYEPSWGGFSRRPKFPRPSGMEFLLRYHRRTGDPGALKMVEFTLTKMAEGGIYDHVGGGFHRYSVDTRWLVPHFEKMLYDNGQLSALYLEAYQVTKKPLFATVARETLDYVMREMTAPEGAYWSATDADSPTPKGHDEEGWFFVWTPDEVRAVVGAERAKVVIAYYGLTQRGNFEGKNIFYRPRPVATVARQLKLTPEQLMAEIAEAKKALYAARLKRPPPILDTKILVSWNGLMISGFARGALVLGEEKYAESARKAARFILGSMRDARGRLLRTYVGEARLNAYLDDYAFLTQGLLDLYEATGEMEWLDAAIALQKTLDAHYADKKNGGYFMTSDDHEKLLAREKPDYDGAEPSGNSVAALNLLRLSEFTTQEGYRKSAERIFAAFGRKLQRASTGLPKLLSALDFYLDTPLEVVVVAPAGPNPLLDVVRQTYLPNRALFRQASGAPAKLPLLEAKVMRDGKPTAYVCEKGRCELPTSDPKVFAKQLEKRKAIGESQSPAPLEVR